MDTTEDRERKNRRLLNVMLEADGPHSVKTVRILLKSISNSWNIVGRDNDNPERPMIPADVQEEFVASPVLPGAASAADTSFHNALRTTEHSGKIL